MAGVRASGEGSGGAARAHPGPAGRGGYPPECAFDRLQVGLVGFVGPPGPHIAVAFGGRAGRASSPYICFGVGRTCASARHTRCVFCYCGRRVSGVRAVSPWTLLLAFTLADQIFVGRG